MNIKNAKEEIKNAMTAYFAKDEADNYIISIEKQRPVFLMGPPGIGKTAIMEQVAQELNVGLVSYSMTHHTRQSALGLPFITHKVYGGVEYEVSEYTMSEIIASVYDMMETTGVKEGILFLDEINCVSETLAPSMLQFLQYKIFGRHKVPDGWIVVTAGNPPEYNNSVREFDIVTWDRLKRIDIEPDYKVWKEYAINKCVHPAITTYLDVKKTDFYSIESTVNGKSFVTARGWEDLSVMMKIYESKNIPVKQTLVEQYLQNKKIARDFAIYYDLFMKYRSDYQVGKILDGNYDDEILERAKNAKFDERLALIGLILQGIFDDTTTVLESENARRYLLEYIKENKLNLSDNQKAVASLKAKLDEIDKYIANGKKSNSVSANEIRMLNIVADEINEYIEFLLNETADTDSFGLIKANYSKSLNKMREDAEKTKSIMNNVFDFAEKAFGEGKETLVIVTEMTTHKNCSQFISHYGCEGYFNHNKKLLFRERRKEILTEIENLNI